MPFPFMSAFAGSNYNETRQDQHNHNTIHNSGDGDVSVVNAQFNATEQDVSGLGLNLSGDYEDEGYGEMWGFTGANANATDQTQDNTNDITNYGDGDVSVANLQGNVTDQSVSGAGINIDDFGIF